MTINPDWNLIKIIKIITIIEFVRVENNALSVPASVDFYADQSEVEMLISVMLFSTRIFFFFILCYLKNLTLSIIQS